MYRLIENNEANGVVRLSDNAHIPYGSARWDDYLYWIAAGNSPELDSDYTIERIKTAKLKELNAQVNQYIYSKYDAGTQATFNALANKYTRMLPNPDATTVLSKLDSVLGWIQSVLVGYYTAKAQVNAMSTISEVEAFNMDYSGFDSADPKITISQVSF